MKPALAALVLVSVAVSSCSPPLPVPAVGGSGPAFDPVVFFAGLIQSWGVLENRSGEPTAVVRTSGRGVTEGADGVHFPQRVEVGDDPPVERDWHMRRVAPGRFEATANDMVGTAQGQAAGRAFHWTWTLALRPGNPLTNVTMDQWWYLQDDGSMLNRTVIRKLGVVVAEVTEHFTRTP